MPTIGLTGSTIAAECGATSRPVLAPGASAFRFDGGRILVGGIGPRASGHFRLKSRCSGCAWTWTAPARPAAPLLSGTTAARARAGS